MILLNGVISLPDATSYDKLSFYFLNRGNSIAADYAVQMHRLVCALVVQMQLNHVFTRQDSITLTSLCSLLLRLETPKDVQ